MTSRRTLTHIAVSLAAIGACAITVSAQAGLLGGVGGSVGGTLNGALNGSLSQGPLNVVGSGSGSGALQGGIVSTPGGAILQPVQRARGAASTAQGSATQQASNATSTAKSAATSTAKPDTNASANAGSGASANADNNLSFSTSYSADGSVSR